MARLNEIKDKLLIEAILNQVFTEFYIDSSVTNLRLERIIDRLSAVQTEVVLRLDGIESQKYD